MQGMLPEPVWHGTPHDVDKFSMDKIGTGEGAQAYGHGLYFAGDEKVGKAYQKNLSQKKDQAYWAIDGKTPDAAGVPPSVFIENLGDDAGRIDYEIGRLNIYILSSIS